MAPPLAAATSLADRTTHHGIVQAVEAGTVVVAVAVQGCSSCGQKKSCGVGKLAGGGKTALVHLPSREGLKIGDTVTLSVGQTELNRAALLGYLLPASLLVTGSVIGNTALNSDAGAALGAAAGLATGLLLTYLIARLFRGAAAPLSIN